MQAAGIHGSNRRLSGPVLGPRLPNQRFTRARGRPLPSRESILLLGFAAPIHALIVRKAVVLLAEKHFTVPRQDDDRINLALRRVYLLILERDLFARDASLLGSFSEGHPAHTSCS